MTTPSTNPAASASSALQSAFAHHVVPGSARYWAAHFSHQDIRSPVQAIFCYAHLMDQLAVASPEIIRDKSLWWHEELERYADGDSRHPVVQILHCVDVHAMAPALHEHLHGALSTQQQVALTTPEEWRQYVRLRLGSLHVMLGIAAGLSGESATVFGEWAGAVNAQALMRSPQLFSGARWSIPQLATSDSEAENQALAQYRKLIAQRPGRGSAASEILLANDSRWWRVEPTQATPLYSNAPVGARGMLRSWRAARATPYR